VCVAALDSIVQRVLLRTPRAMAQLEKCCLSLTGPHAIEAAAAAFWRNWGNVSHDFSADYSLVRSDGR